MQMRITYEFYNALISKGLVGFCCGCLDSLLADAKLRKYIIQ
jgi:hypothetical protein